MDHLLDEAGLGQPSDFLGDRAPPFISYCWIYALEANNKVIYCCHISLFIIVVYHAITVLSGNFNTRVVYNNQVPGNALDTGSLVN